MYKLTKSWSTKSPHRFINPLLQNFWFNKNFSSSQSSVLGHTYLFQTRRLSSEVYEELNAVEAPVVKIQDISAAREAVKVLMAHPHIYHACDTETYGIDVKQESPVGNGKVVCFSIHSGPDIEFQGIKGASLWVDNYGECKGLVQEFKAWFENPNYQKVWHNYGFDRHILYNEGIDCRGFGGDTMHMARLWDASRDQFFLNGKGYSLEALTEDLLQRPKISMKKLFAVAKNRKDGTPGKSLELPPIEDIHCDPNLRESWVRYSTYDAESTWLLRNILEDKLHEMGWLDNKDMWEFYKRYFIPFGELLTDMERAGVYVNTNMLNDIEQSALKESTFLTYDFREWLHSMAVPDWERINLQSSTQLQILFFGGYESTKTGVSIPAEKVFKIDKDEMEIQNENDEFDRNANSYARKLASELKDLCKEKKLKQTGDKNTLLTRLQIYDTFSSMSDDSLRSMCVSRQLDSSGDRIKLLQRLVYSTEKVQENIAPAAPPSKQREILVTTFGLEPTEFTTSGLPAISTEVLKALAGSPFSFPPVYGSAYEEFGCEYTGTRACEAIYNLSQVRMINTILSTFVSSLRESVDANGRVHCSLNLNTETGRLSARRPNLQNQPALEKDQFKIRKAFQAVQGKTLIVADYGQLELRILAHITNCKSMIDAFAKGGCFHSRTAAGMFAYIQNAINKGEVLLEWDHNNGKPPAPLLKDIFGAERRQAKTLNFSIAYGKTVHGLAQDWGISKEKAQEILDAWYADRPEVDKWQKSSISSSRNTGVSKTLMGRCRPLPELKASSQATRKHAERAAINTPIQGSAADIVMMGMLKIHNDQRLKELGWKLLLQIHDEVILEGPKETVEEALELVKYDLTNPWDYVGLFPLRVPLTVDAKTAETWFDAK